MSEKIIITDNKKEKNTVLITTICGPMCAGKSAKIIQIASGLESNEIKYMCLKPKIDHREINGESTKDRIVSRGANLIVKATELELDFDEKVSQEIIKKDLEAFIFDEVQFFKLESIKKFIEVAKNNDRVIRLFFAGLDMDFQGKKFETVEYLQKISNETILLTADCSVDGCKERAKYSSKISGDKNQRVQIGNDMYKPTCEKHFFEILNGANIEIIKEELIKK